MSKKKYNNITVKDETGDKTENEISSITGNPVLSSISLLFLCTGLIWSLFFQGFFFIRDSFYYYYLTLFLLSIWIFLIIRNNVFLKSYIIPSALAFIVFIFYGLSFYWSADKSLAIEEFLKSANYFFVFLIALLTFSKKRFFDYKNILNINKEESENKIIHHNIKPLLAFLITIIISGLIIVFAGLLIRTDPDSETFGYIMFDRLFSLLQYPNATASFLMIAFIVTVGILPLMNNYFFKKLLPFFSSVFLAGILLTYSRGVWVTIPISCLLLILMTEKGSRLKTTLNIFVPTISCLLSFFFIYFMNMDSYTGSLLLLLLLLPLTLLIEMIKEKFLLLQTKIKATVIIAIIFICIISLTVFTTLALKGPVSISSPSTMTVDYPSVTHSLPTDNLTGIYSVSFNVKAEEPNNNQVETNRDDNNLWHLSLTGYSRVEHSTKINEFMLYEFYGGAEDNWQDKEATIRLEEPLDRIEISFSLLKPGVSATLKDVKLELGNRSETITFWADRILPTAIYERLFSYRNIIAATQRFVHQYDALKIAADYPLLGAGGGSWEALYLSYIDREYYTREIHNHTLKIWTDSGIFALTAYLALIALFIIKYFRFRFEVKSKPGYGELKTLYTVIFVMIISLFLHSQLDFILSYGLFNIVFYTLIAAGLSISAYSTADKIGIRTANVFLLIVGGAAATVLFATITYHSQLILYEKALDRSDIGLIEETEMMLESINDKNYSFHQLYALKAKTMEELAQKEEHTPEEEHYYAQIALGSWEKAYSLAPHNSEYRQRLGILLIQFGEIERAVSLIDSIIEINPYNDDHYRQIATVKIDLARHYKDQSEDPEKARKMLEENLELRETMTANKGSAAVLNYHTGKTYLLLGDIPAARHYLNMVKADDIYYEMARELIRQTTER